MIGDYYLEGFDRKHSYGEEVVVQPKTCLFIPARRNLRAIINVERELRKAWYEPLLMPSSLNDREVPALFWDRNLISKGCGTYIFETRYASDSDDILPQDYLRTLPDWIKKGFLRKVSKEVHKLANKLVGKEKDSRRILQSFYDFVHQHLRPEDITTNRPISKLLREYESTGYFSGNCKEARNFFMALCDAQDYPTKAVLGKALKSYGHVWVDVFVPVEKKGAGGYNFFPVDASLGYFGYHNPMNNLFFEYTPDMHSGALSRVLDLAKREKTPESYRLSIERVK